MSRTKACTMNVRFMKSLALLGGFFGYLPMQPCSSCQGQAVSLQTQPLSAFLRTEICAAAIQKKTLDAWI